MELFHQLPTVLELSHKGPYSHQHFFEQGMPKWAETNKMELNKKNLKICGYLGRLIVSADIRQELSRITYYYAHVIRDNSCLIYVDMLH